MHLAAAEPGRIDDGDVAVDLAQPPGEIVFLSSADTELAVLASAAARLGRELPSLRLANPMQLAHPLSVDLYLQQTASKARIVAVRAMGGVGYWRYGLEELRRLARAGGPELVVVPGDDRADAELDAYSTVSATDAHRLWRYAVEGGADNAENLLRHLAHLAGLGASAPEPRVLPGCGCYLTGVGATSLPQAVAGLPAGVPVVPLVFYRALIETGSTAPVDALAEALADVGLAVLPVFIPSLKNAEAETFLAAVFAAAPPALILNATAFAVAKMGGAHAGTILDRPGRPVFQVIFSLSSEEAWRASPRGLSARDLTMNIVLPEVDGRITSRAVSFKAEARFDALTQSRVTTYRPAPDRVRFVADLAAAWARLAGKPARERRVAILLANYPSRDGRIANGVGLDTPESAVRLAAAMAVAGYDATGFPQTSADLMGHLLDGPRNRRKDGGAAEGRSEMAAARSTPENGVRLSLGAYLSFLATLPPENRAALAERWGQPETDPFFDDGNFVLAAQRHGNVVIAIQPSRGYDIDPKATYHDPALVPPHRYLAFYAWLRREFAADAVVQLGKHGNLEWLPGKALGLSATCWPEVALGALPVIYPFIVNDPGEGAQAKRRSAAVVVDHLMPAMTRAETQGALAELETLIDEYYLAAGGDPRRRAYLEREIAALAGRTGLDRDLGLLAAGDTAPMLRALDAHLCDLKEMQIRDGLHIFGASPSGRLRVDTLAAIARTPRPGGRPADASLPRAIAADCGLANFDPLNHDAAAEWHGPRPSALASISSSPWRTAGDTGERIALLAATLIAGEAPVPGRASAAVLDWIETELAPSLDRSGAAETAAVLAALDGRFVPPGPSGAPTRGRPEVLPTGRNFYSVDVRGVPTRAAWALGRAAADAVALRYFQDEGEWPRSIAMSAWGTSNMRTGGDDVAQVLALIGAAPVWEPGTGRVTGFTIIPLADLGRPRVDVTLRVSGMFRDAFPQQIDLIDSAVRAISGLDEPTDANPLAAATRSARKALEAKGIPAELAARRAATRVFGSMPGAYGAGLQALIDEGIWDRRSDFAEAFLAWSGFAYGGGAEGEGARALLSERLAVADAVLHNQDNREHDILDSDDYYQFQGGLAATVETLKGRAPRLYHGDHALAETPKVRSLAEEIARVVRGRAANPKWIAGMIRHGYKGAFEIAATVDYLFAYAATTDAVGDHHFDQLYDAYLADERVQAFIAEANPAALAEMAARLLEAIRRGLWRPAANSAEPRLMALVGEKLRAAE